MGVCLDIQAMPEHIENHKSYVQSWIQEIRDKPETLVETIKDAQQAAGYMDMKAGFITKAEFEAVWKSATEVRVKGEMGERNGEVEGRIVHLLHVNAKEYFVMFAIEKDEKLITQLKKLTKIVVIIVWLMWYYIVIAYFGIMCCKRRRHMRYRKRISLGGGSHINLSKSGVSFTGGMKGLSMTFGKSGTYVNYGIPGSGIYNRKKIGGGSNAGTGSQRSAVYNGSRQLAEGQPVHLELKLTYCDDGTVIFKDASGNEITDPALIRKIKSTPEYKAELERMTNDRMNEYDSKMEDVINIQRLTPRVCTIGETKNRINNISPHEYIFKSFDEPMPSIETVISDLRAEAEKTIQSRLKLKKAKLCDRYVADTKDIEYNNRLEDWKKRKEAFLKQEEIEKSAFEENEKKRCEREKIIYRKLLEGDSEIIEKVILSWLSDVSFDFEFNLEYELTDEGVLFVDLDLPEIEDMPTQRVQKMANGTAKFKVKPQKEIKADYSKCVFGLAVFFAGNLFNRALNSQKIVISGYTQRRNKKGDIVDDYIYSIQFKRDSFVNLDYMNDDPRENCMKFQNRCNQNADMLFKTIEPYSIDDIKEEA